MRMEMEPQSNMQQKTQRIRGDIVSLADQTLTVHRVSGDTVTIEVPPTVPLSAVRKLSLSDIKPGSFIGTAATTDVQGRLTAQEVVVFPEAARGTGEGHYAWDLGPRSTMTNANVDAIVDSTNGTNVKLSYKGGKKDITVPPNVPIVTFVPADRTDLSKGKKVFVIATGSGPNQFVAQRVVVEKDGVVPPM
ncbi:hypothetical protein [Povalibacter sp.]|uniref:hypothetical protein n=1 Tax=Povalibacter sp. TaxID=1962978 RepID=UPI0032C21DB9